MTPATEAQVREVLTSCDVQFQDIRLDPASEHGLLLHTIHSDEPARLRKFDCVAAELDERNLVANGRSG